MINYSERRSPLEEKRLRTKRVAGFVGLFGGAVVVAILGMLAYAHFTAVPHDEETNCPESYSDLVAYTAVLVDATDSMSPVQIDGIQEIIRAAALQLPPDGRLDIYKLGNSDSIVDLVYSRCCLDAGGGGLGLTDNPRLQKAIWEDKYWGPLLEQLELLKDIGPARNTLLMEGVQKVASEFPFEVAPQLREEGWRLIIVTDLLQNSSAYSAYGERRPSFDEFQKQGEFYRVLARLRGADVTIHLVHRPQQYESGIQDRELMEFWNNWFEHCESEDFRITRLIG